MDMKKIAFEKKLRILHELGNELSLTKSVKELCRLAVELGRNRLGFDRLSTWFVDPNDPNFIVGSFGVDEKGRIREEALERVTIDEDPAMKQIHADMAHSVLRNGVPLRDNSGKAVGRGSHIIAAIWNGKEVVGYLSTDNLLKGKSFTEHDRELAELFASTFGHLYSLKKAEEALHTAYTHLRTVQSRLIQAAKMEVVGGLATGVAHEVKNPLAIMLQGIDYLSKKVKAEDENDTMILHRMRGAVKKADNIITGLLDFSTWSELKFVSHNLNAVIEASLLLVRHEIDSCKINVTKEFTKKLPRVKIDKNKIEQVFVNIFLNAIHYMPDGGRLSIRTYGNGVEGPEAAVFVEIEDTGQGVPKNILNRVFDPFFTTRRGSGGTGLGLSIARNIMDMHKGRIGIENVRRGHGAKVTLTFKRQSAGEG